MEPDTSYHRGFTIREWIPAQDLRDGMVGDVVDDDKSSLPVLSFLLVTWHHARASCEHRFSISHACIEKEPSSLAHAWGDAKVLL